MQTRDYDDYIHVPSLVGFRQVIDLNRKKKQLGMASINILNESKDNVCIAEYKWIDFHQKAVYIRLHRDTVV